MGGLRVSVNAYLCTLSQLQDLQSRYKLPGKEASKVTRVTERPLFTERSNGKTLLRALRSVAVD